MTIQGVLIGFLTMVVVAGLELGRMGCTVWVGSDKDGSGSLSAGVDVVWFGEVRVRWATG